MDHPRGPSRSTAYHELRYTYDPARSRVWREICKYLQKWISPNSSILDLGAGYGDFLRYIKAREKFGLEWQESLVSHWPKEVHPAIQSACDPWPLNREAIDVVFSSNFFEHFRLEEIQSQLTEVRRVLKPGGILIVVQPNIRLQLGRYFDDFTHKAPFTETSFCDFLKSLGWQIGRCEGRFLPFTMRSHLPKWQWLVRLYLALPFRPFAGQFLVVAEKPKDA